MNEKKLCRTKGGATIHIPTSAYRLNVRHFSEQFRETFRNIRHETLSTLTNQEFAALSDEDERVLPAAGTIPKPPTKNNPRASTTSRTNNLSTQSRRQERHKNAPQTLHRPTALVVPQTITPPFSSSPRVLLSP